MFRWDRCVLISRISISIPCSIWRISQSYFRLLVSILGSLRAISVLDFKQRLEVYLCKPICSFQSNWMQASTWRQDSWGMDRGKLCSVDGGAFMYLRCEQAKITINVKSAVISRFSVAPQNQCLAKEVSACAFLEGSVLECRREIDKVWTRNQYLNNLQQSTDCSTAMHYLHSNAWLVGQAWPWRGEYISQWTGRIKKNLG